MAQFGSSLGNTILISGSSAQEIEQLSSFLQKNKHHILTASSSEEAEKIARRYFPNLIICTSMGMLDELNFLRELRLEANFKYMMSFIVARGEEKEAFNTIWDYADDFIIIKPSEPIPDNISHRVEWLLTIQKFKRQIEVGQIREETIAQKLDATISAIEDGVIITNSVGGVENINPAALRMLNFKTTPSFFDLNRTLQFSPHHNFTKEKNFEIQKGDKTFQAYNATIITPGGEETILTVLRDVTLVRHLDQIKSDFISLVSHELRTPLTALSNVFQLLGDEPEGLSKRDQDLLAIGQRNEARLRQLINDLLDLSKLEAGKMQYKWGKISSTSVIENVISSTKVLGENKGLNFKVIPYSGTSHIYADSSRIEQVLTNIIGNAVKFSPSGGEIKIEQKGITSLNIPSAAKKDLEKIVSSEIYIQISISDQGPGIAIGDIDRLFNKFQQLESVITHSEKGTGLGLAIAKSIIRDHGGSIWAESSIGEGTTIKILLPIFSPTHQWFIHLNSSVIQASYKQQPLTVIAITTDDPSWLTKYESAVHSLVKTVCKREGDNPQSFHDLPGLALFLPGLTIHDRKVIEDRLIQQWEKLIPEIKPKILKVSFPDERDQFNRLLNWILPEGK